jgi:hypothetical protein
MSRWCKQISNFSDIVDFKDYLRSQYAKYANDGREFPAQIVVSGEAYGVIREKVNLQRKRFGIVLWSMVRGIFSGGVTIPIDLARQVGGYALEAYGDQGKEIIKAAGIVALCYYSIEEDTGSTLTLNYVWDDDNPYAEPPDLY